MVVKKGEKWLFFCTSRRSMRGTPSALASSSSLWPSVNGASKVLPREFPQVASGLFNKHCLCKLCKQRGKLWVGGQKGSILCKDSLLRSLKLLHLFFRKGAANGGGGHSGSAQNRGRGR